MLRQQMMEMYEAYISEKPPPSSILDYLNKSMPPPNQVSTSDPIYPTRFKPYANISNVAGTSTMRPSSKPMISTPHFVATTPTSSVRQPTMMPKSNDDPSSKFFMIMVTPVKRPLKFQALIPHVHQYSSPIKV